MEERKKLEAMVNELNMYQGQADVLNQQMETVKSTMLKIRRKIWKLCLIR